ncbi:MAG: hypothetical protein PUF48_03605 [Oscillospiraceae bacterium]|nr:hypothetical protein [Oscillospiraceae bacterium]
MKCTNCGFESFDAFGYCPECGTAAPIAEPVSLNPVADKVVTTLKDNLFLVICILMSAATVFFISANSINIIYILITVFLWLTYASGRKGIADNNQLRNVSGCVYADYIITNVISIILIVCGVIFTLLLGLFVNTPELMEELASEIGTLYPEYASVILSLISAAAWIIGVVFALIGVGILLINLFGMRKIHRFIKSVHEGIPMQNPNFANPAAAKGWLIFFGVCSGISTLASLSVDFKVALANGCSAAVMILSAILINKHFVAEK